MIGYPHGVFQAVYQQFICRYLEDIGQGHECFKGHGLSPCLDVAYVHLASIHKFRKRELRESSSLSDGLDPLSDGDRVEHHNGTS